MRDKTQENPFIIYCELVTDTVTHAYFWIGFV